MRTDYGYHQSVSPTGREGRVEPYFRMSIPYGIEVIGNIYENPELLEEGK
jgi:hypothetical protein